MYTHRAAVQTQQPANQYQNNPNGVSNTHIEFWSSMTTAQVGNTVILTVTSNFYSQTVDWWLNSGSGWLDVGPWTLDANGGYSTTMTFSLPGTRQMYVKASNGVLSNTVTIVVNTVQSTQTSQNSITLNFRDAHVPLGGKDAWSVQSTFPDGVLKMYWNIGMGWVPVDQFTLDGSGSSYGSETMIYVGIYQIKAQTLDGTTVSNIVSVTVP